jgi:uncharacterized protein (TIGR00369 family)
MGLKLRIDGDRVRGSVTLDERQEGAPGFAHGGALATLLDDALGTLLVVLQRPAVTANLSIDYRAPVFIGRPLELEAWAESIDGRKLHLAGKIIDAESGKLVAEGTALFLEVDLTHFEQGTGRPIDWGMQFGDTPIPPY